MIVSLRRPYESRYGTPTLHQVDEAIFKRKYFTHCMSCDFCHDSCCAYGMDADIETVRRIQTVADKLEQFTGISREQWFTGQFTQDPEFPGGSYTRTRTVDGACVFLNRTGRGCMIHSFCLAEGMDYHELKPIVGCLFPVTFHQGLLLPSDEVQDNTLVCLNNGPTLYRGVRDDLRYYFGNEFIDELDELEKGIN